METHETQMYELVSVIHPSIHPSTFICLSAFLWVYLLRNCLPIFESTHSLILENWSRFPPWFESPTRCIWSSLHALVHVCIQKVVSPILYTSWHIHVCIDNCINKYKFYKHRYEVSSWQFCLHRNRYYIYVYTHIFRNIDIKSSVVYIYIDISLYNHIISKLKILFKILFELT